MEDSTPATIPPKMEESIDEIKPLIREGDYDGAFTALSLFEGNMGKDGHYPLPYIRVKTVLCKRAGRVAEAAEFLEKAWDKVVAKQVWIGSEVGRDEEKAGVMIEAMFNTGLELVRQAAKMSDKSKALSSLHRLFAELQSSLLAESNRLASSKSNSASAFSSLLFLYHNFYVYALEALEEVGPILPPPPVGKNVGAPRLGGGREREKGGGGASGGVHQPSFESDDKARAFIDFCVASLQEYETVVGSKLAAKASTLPISVSEVADLTAQTRKNGMALAYEGALRYLERGRTKDAIHMFESVLAMCASLKKVYVEGGLEKRGEGKEGGQADGGRPMSRLAGQMEREKALHSTGGRATPGLGSALPYNKEEISLLRLLLKVETSALNNLAGLYLQTAQVEEALDKCKRAVDIRKRHYDRFLRRRAEKTRLKPSASTTSSSGDGRSSHRDADDSRDHIEDEHHRKALGKAFLNLGTLLHQRLFRRREALEMYELTLEMWAPKREGAKPRTGLEKAVDVYKDYDLKRALVPIPPLIRLLNQLAAIELEAESFDSAEYLFSQVLARREAGESEGETSFSFADAVVGKALATLRMSTEVDSSLDALLLKSTAIRAEEYRRKICKSEKSPTAQFKKAVGELARCLRVYGRYLRRRQARKSSTDSTSSLPLGHSSPLTLLTLALRTCITPHSVVYECAPISPTSSMKTVVEQIATMLCEGTSVRLPGGVDQLKEFLAQNKKFSHEVSTELVEILLEMGGALEDGGEIEPALDAFRKAVALREGVYEAKKEEGNGEEGEKEGAESGGESGRVKKGESGNGGEKGQDEIDEKEIDLSLLIKSYNVLALLHQRLGQTAEALNLYEKAFSAFIRETNVGVLAWEEEKRHDDGTLIEAEYPLLHPSLRLALALSSNNTGVLYEGKGMLEQALKYYKNSMVIREVTSGANDADVAMSLNNIALLYQKMGNSTAALPFYERSLQIRLKVFGETSADVATSMYNIALLHHKRGELDQAESLYSRALEIGESTLGKDHPHIATLLNNLAGLHQKRGSFEVAVELCERALKIKEKALGSRDSPGLLQPLNNLILLLKRVGRTEDALPLFKRVQAIKSRM